MPRLQCEANASAHNRRLSSAGIKTAATTSIDSWSTNTDGCAERCIYSNPSLPSFQELLFSLASSPVSSKEELIVAQRQHVFHSPYSLPQPSLSIFNQPDATYFWRNFQPAHPDSHDPFLYVEQARLSRFSPSSSSREKSTLGRDFSSSVITSRHLSDSQLKHQLDGLHSKCSPSECSDTQSHSLGSELDSGDLSSRFDDESTTNVEESKDWNDHVVERMVEGGKKVLVCQWISSDDGSHCGYYNLKKALVRRHVEVTHIGLRNHQCHYCTHAFGQKTTRKSHEWRVHLKIKPLACQICEKCFNDHARLSKHTSKVHGVVSKPRKAKPELI